MIEKTTKASRFNWRLQSCAAFVAFVVFVAIAVCQADTSLMLFLFVVAPILLVISILLLIYAAIGKGRSQRLPLLSMLAILWTISTSVFVYDIKHPSAIRSAARWFVWSQSYKDKVLAQPTSANGDLKHIEWDGWGMFGQDNSVFLVLDPTDTLSTAALRHQSGKFNGISCEVRLVSRLEKHWYSDMGDQYIKCMHLGGDYAYAGRDWVCEKVAKILGAPILEEVHNHHNFAWRETHDGEEYWVVRKGATPAFPGQKGFVGGTMGETSVILEGVENDEAKHSLYSTVHGAGRVMGRMEARGKTDRSTGQVLRPGRVTTEMMQQWLKRANVELRGAGLDESPDCYKRLPEVLAEHGKSIRILHTLTPVGVAMAGANEFDPYKD